jgi:hypothetical protein
MSSIADTTPRTGRRNFNLRAYLAGTAATAALIGAVVFAFASLGAYVAFNGLPIGGHDDGAEATNVSVAEPTVKSQVAKNHGGSASATDARRDTGSGGAQAHSSNGNSAASDNSTGVASPPVTAGPAETGGGSTGDTSSQGPNQEATAANPPESGEAPSSSIPTPHVSTPDSVGGTVGTVEQTLNEAGVEVPLNEAGSSVDDLTGSVLGN